MLGRALGLRGASGPTNASQWLQRRRRPVPGLQSGRRAGRAASTAARLQDRGQIGSMAGGTRGKSRQRGGASERLAGAVYAERAPAGNVGGSRPSTPGTPATARMSCASAFSSRRPNSSN